MRSNRHAKQIQTTKELVRDTLGARYPKDLVDAGLDAYAIGKRAALSNDFQKAEANLTLFCEAAIRICRQEVAPPFTALGDPAFKVDIEVNACLQSAKGPSDSFRLLMPNTIRAMYGIRNRRGVDHLSQIKPNHIDARVLAAQADWIVAELFRLATTHDFSHAQRIVDSLVERQIPFLEQINGQWKLLDPRISTDDAVLLVLYHDEGVSQADLVSILKRAQPTISSVVKRLDAEGFLHKSNRELFITSSGRKRVEALPELAAA